MADCAIQPESVSTMSSSSTFVASEKASKHLRVTCYGSSSSKTPEDYIQAAWSVGYILAQRGHICVNGAGATGCMGAMNKGAVAGNGHIVGVIHEMFVVDGADWFEGGESPFANANAKDDSPSSDGDPNKGTPIRELIIAGGNDLQERKRLLVEGADALIVLPGGPGTWDELWEMACTRQHGMSEQPIVCVNVQGFYEPFQKMLKQAYEEGLIESPPEDIVHFEDTPEGAIRWVEDEKAGLHHHQQQQHQKQHAAAKTEKPFFMSALPKVSNISGLSSLENIPSILHLGMALAAGVIVGVAFGRPKI